MTPLPAPWVFHMLIGSAGLALAACLTWALLRLWRRRPIASYRLMVAVVASAVALPLAQLLVEGRGPAVEMPFGGALAALRVEQVAPLPELDGPRADADAPAPEGPIALPGELVLVPQIARAEEQAAREAAPVTATVTSTDGPRSGRPSPLALGIGLYVAGALFALFRLARRLRETGRLIRTARPVSDAAVLEVWDSVAARSPLRDRIRLLTSDRLQVPACFGLRRHVVVLPGARTLVERPEILRCILLHELVHLERRDSWVMLMQGVFDVLFWFHPAAWWLSSRLDALRELSCDLLVVRRTGRRKRYASALVEYAALMEQRLGGSGAAPAALLPWTGSKSPLTRRIEMLVSGSTPSSRFGGTSLAAVALLFAGLWGGQLALASVTAPQDTDDTQDRTTADTQDFADVPVLAGLIDTQLADAADAHDLVDVTQGPVAAVQGSQDGPTASLIQRVAGVQSSGQGVTLGVLLTDVGDQLLLVDDVLDGSIAEACQVKAKDMIFWIDGTEATRKALGKAKQKVGKGQSVEIRVLRDGEVVEIDLVDQNHSAQKRRLAGLVGADGAYLRALVKAGHLEESDLAGILARSGDASQADLWLKRNQDSWRSLMDNDAWRNWQRANARKALESGQRYGEYLDQKALSEFYRKANESLLRGDMQAAHDIYSKLGELSGEDLYRQARSYYDRVDAETYRRHLEMAVNAYEAAIASGLADDRTKHDLDSIRGVLEGQQDLGAYIESVRGLLERGEYAKAFDAAARDLHTRIYDYTSVDNTKRAGNQKALDEASALVSKQKSKLEDLEDQLEQTERMLREQQRQIDELRKALGDATQGGNVR